MDKNINRIAALDWMRGMVMVLMALDHASAFFNQGRVANDTIVTHMVGSGFVAEQFFTRWVTHLCAPTFVFLTGTAMALSIVQRREKGMDSKAIDRDLFIRGAFIALLDIVVFSFLSGKLYLQVLYAIGVSMMMMALLYRLGKCVLLISALTLLFGGEAFTVLFWQPQGEVPLWLALTFAPWFSESFTVLYPVIPWLAIMMLGWVFGDWLITRKKSAWSVARVLLVGSLLALACFLLVRGFNGYGNMLLYREDHSLIQWLHVSKYPPSISYISLELGLMAIMLAAMLWLQPKIGIRPYGPILVFGQTALFFYLAHFPVLAMLTLFLERAGLGQAYLAAIITLAALYPVCCLYRALKWRYPDSILRFV
ncbi:DUF1624 domain-containing protein [Nitrosomonas sp. Nm33]|uniref:DUF1624 domain-containing protein n=1 Tax=Nitrosomonas sp. Nm33 TaxID=133724 RepID=UPI00089977F3|nr:heparan-alpha-glucosaminide N-acetyltransferase domain-containing protein [Nitrosomonas sp. Nm33]SDY36771.1 Uncharacterized membrane protein [Nitrosomonas sp. Nm33]